MSPFGLLITTSPWSAYSKSFSAGNRYLGWGRDVVNVIGTFEAVLEAVDADAELHLCSLQDNEAIFLPSSACIVYWHFRWSLERRQNLELSSRQLTHWHCYAAGNDLIISFLEHAWQILTAYKHLRRDNSTSWSMSKDVQR